MSKNKKVSELKTIEPASTLLQKFLSENNITLDLEIQPKGFITSGDGFLMSDKPLLKVVAKYVK